MTKRALFIPLAATILLAAEIAVSCSSRGNSTEGTSETALISDTVTVIAWEDRIGPDGLKNGEFLPDTSYESTNCLEVKIEVFDTTTSPEVGLRDLYEDAPGIFTFRKSPARTADFNCRVEKSPDSLAIKWTFNTDYDSRKSNIGSWGGGTGWTGQPLYVEWPEDILDSLKSKVNLKLSSNKEIIFGSLASRLYFLDFETGKPSRSPIYVYHPIKGTPMLDPTLNGYLYVGHGVKADPSRDWGQLTVDVFKNEIIDFLPHDPKAWRNWNGNDSSPIRVGNFVFRPSENGTVYKWRISDSRPVLHSTMKFRRKGFGAGGMEATLSVWRNYGYINDNLGNVICFNLNTLKPVWHYYNHDDCDSTPVVSIENGHVYIYTGSEVDLSANSDVAHFIKLDALSGELIWDNQSRCKRLPIGEKHFDGGYYATTLLGAGNCSDRVFINRVRNENHNQNGEFVAIDKTGGKDIFNIKLNSYGWSSAVGILDADENMTVFVLDASGYAYLIDGKSGEIKTKLLLGYCCESSPILVGNKIIVGVRGQNLYCMEIL